jgi:hypothetical protein
VCRHGGEVTRLSRAPSQPESVFVVIRDGRRFQRRQSFDHQVESKRERDGELHDRPGDVEDVRPSSR